MTRHEQDATRRTTGDPYVNLVAAVLRQAVHDASHGAPSLHGHPDWAVPEQARAFLRGEPDLTTWCDLVNADVDRVRGRLLREAGLLTPRAPLVA
jgi:hypothetical protein